MVTGGWGKGELHQTFNRFTAVSILASYLGHSRAQGRTSSTSPLFSSSAQRCCANGQQRLGDREGSPWGRQCLLQAEDWARAGTGSPREIPPRYLQFHQIHSICHPSSEWQERGLSGYKNLGQTEKQRGYLKTERGSQPCGQPLRRAFLDSFHCSEGRGKALMFPQLVWSGRKVNLRQKRGS